MVGANRLKGQCKAAADALACTCPLLIQGLEEAMPWGSCTLWLHDVCFVQMHSLFKHLQACPCRIGLTRWPELP
jgi:hypothetical protein